MKVASEGTLLQQAVHRARLLVPWSNIYIIGIRPHAPGDGIRVYTCRPHFAGGKRSRRLPRISIDYGVIEKADNVWAVPGDFGWDDLGTWTALE
ncbi:hypothetical protein SAMN02745218_02608 [Desulfofundulus australicus DSM 11792]|uniref:Uncharacterized protein n=2 Tax=Desulfofundulus australicus TaxID=1566 RepID=A0A1M5CR77_9FIRM|nr:hypothetical protein SAMN02745218_02608 [Desulfofundulus australicus DSM 11792]